MFANQKLFLCFIFSFITHFLYAQKYITAGGVRMSKNEVGLTLQQHIVETVTLEGLAIVNANEYYFSALIEKHNKILWGEGFNSYFGAGPRYGVYRNDTAYYGADFIFGVEYKMLLFPVVLSADIKPGFRIEQDKWFELGVGVSFRYIFNKEKRNKLFDGKKKKKD
ncbi:MAG: hypothetical protein H7Y00_11820 [Fimbriimonadaceae bacterium]|nr:hypothetical protein [Chitinophagales bacterium]